MTVILACLCCALTGTGPYEAQVARQRELLGSSSPAVRQRAAEALGWLRAYTAEPALVVALRDPAPVVRRAAALSLGWCGSRAAVGALVAALDEPDPQTARGAWVALTNLTGQELPPERARWQAWWAGVPVDSPPAEVLALLAGSGAPAWTVTASSSYKGPPEVVLLPDAGPDYWQTKNVAAPQWLQLDGGAPRELSTVTIRQWGPGYTLTDYELAVSDDGVTFRSLLRRRGPTPTDLVVRFAPCRARYLRLIGHASERPLYPTTFRRVWVGEPDTGGDWRRERGLRALGALGGHGATEAVLAALPARLPATPATRAGLRALGRLAQPAGVARLRALLDDPYWARWAAEALGDAGDPSVVPALAAAYARYARHLDGTDPADLPRDDKMGFPSEDRMLETPFELATALSRLPARPADLAPLAPLLVANLPGDYDTFMLFEPEVAHLLTRHLLESAGLRQEAAEQAFVALGQPRRVAATAPSLGWPVKYLSPALEPRCAAWLPCVVTEAADLDRLVALLAHPNGWVRLNAAKTLGWLRDPRAVEPLTRALAGARAEGDYPWGLRFKDEEFGDPCPRWREGLVRALGLLGSGESLAGVLDDAKSVLEVRRAAAQALADVGTPAALDVLRRTAVGHDYATVRQVARDALVVRGLDAQPTAPPAPTLPAAASPATGPPALFAAQTDALVFVQGDNDLPSSKGTVEQADRWRQTYVVTDEGPVYRPGDRLCVLRGGQVSTLTPFTSGWVGEPEVSWDGREIVFTRREADSPWWHLWRIGADGSDCRQLTFGPFQDVGPAYLADGRLVFASSRGGVRDEYHGYLCTALYVMNRDGSDLHAIATNIGRDNEPVLLPDGRIAFTRLEVFYSRNKTELTLHAVFPDGTHDVVLYGPERRQFWRQLDHGAPDPADGQEAPLTHRVLRVTQPQPLPDGRIVVVTQAGLCAVGSDRYREELLCPDYKTRAYTTPCPLADGTLLCACTAKTPNRKQVDLGLYRFDPRTGKLELIFNDPLHADYEPRPLAARRPPPVLPETVTPGAYTGRLVCASVFNSQDPEVARRGRLVRLIEGVPVPQRHATQTGKAAVWQNHGGTFARVLATAPLAPDGSFSLELPADRLAHLQVLDSDRRVLGNQLTWINVRPGETKSCAGCHEHPATAVTAGRPQALADAPVDCRPNGWEFTYRAKAWLKGILPAETEERTRTVHAVGLLAR